MSEVNASMECAPAMWCAGELVIVKDMNGSEHIATLIDARLEWINHLGAVWLYETLISGEVVRVFEKTCGDLRINRYVDSIDPYCTCEKNIYLES